MLNYASLFVINYLDGKMVVQKYPSEQRNIQKDHIVSNNLIKRGIFYIF